MVLITRIFKNWVVNFDKKEYGVQKKICIKPLRDGIP